jgi:hypothetical protein
MLKYRAYRVQSGRGLGNVLGKLFRSALPILKKGIKFLAPQAAKYGSRVLADVSEGTDVLESLKKNAKQSGNDIVEALVTTNKKQTGKGVKRGRKTPVTRQPRAKKRRTNHMRTAPPSKKSKPRRRPKFAKSSKRSLLVNPNINDVFKYGY